MGIQNQNGSSLVEVMVALFVLAIGLLGVLAMQSKSMQYNQSAHVYSQAVYLANDMAERMRSNVAGIANYASAIPTGEPGTDCNLAPCEAAALAEWDKYRWSANVEKFLPGGDALIEQLPAAGAVPLHYRVSVKFDDSRSDGKENGVDGYSGIKSYSLIVEI